MSDDAAEFWQAFETETGEKVEARCIGEWLRGEGGSLWGLLVLTDKNFRYRHLPSEGWFESLLKFGSRNRKNAPSDKVVDIVIPREQLVLDIAIKRGLLTRLIEPAFPRFTARRAGTEEVYVFSADPGGNLVAALRAIAASKA